MSNDTEAAAQAPDPRPGDYYVSVIDGPRRALIAGPFRDDHAKALELVPATRLVAERLDPRAAFYAFGTARLDPGESNPVGSLNKFLGIGADQAQGSGHAPAAA